MTTVPIKAMRVGSVSSPTSVHPSPVDAQPVRPSTPRKAIVVRSSEMYVFVNRRMFHRCWFAMMLAHCVFAAFPILIGLLYRYLLTTNFLDMVLSYSLAVHPSYFPSIANGYFFGAAVHCCMILLYIVRSLQCRELVFRLPLCSLSSSRTSATTSGSSDGSTTRCSIFPRAVATLKDNIEELLVQIVYTIARALLQSLLLCLPRVCWRIVGVVIAAGNACVDAMDIQSDNYELFFLFREIPQTFLQTYQAYRLGTFVPRLWMNNLTVGLIVLNCWSTPLIRFFFAKSTSVGQTRLCCALVSVLLDTVSFTVIPIALFQPYYEQFDRTMRTFDRMYGYMDLWLVQMINELQVLFVVSLYDAFSKAMVMSSIARWLHAITKIVQLRDGGSGGCSLPNAPTHLAIVPFVPAAKPTIKAAVVPHVASSTRTPSKALSTPVLLPPPSLLRVNAVHLHQAGKTWKHRVVAAGNRFLTLWGGVVLVTHVHAMTHPLHPQCRLQTRPWFTAKPGCSLLEVNCVEEQIAGAAFDIARIVERVDASHIEHLVVRHCRSLEMPPHIGTLSHLMGLKIYNSSLVGWSDAAALTNVRHPMLRFFFLVDVNATALPPALYAHDFPSQLSQIVISRSNLTALPDALEASWPKRLVLILEGMALTAFPAVVPRLEPLYLSLAYNNLFEIPRALFEHAYLPLLILNGNPITAFPTDLRGPQPHLGWISAMETHLERLPEWMTHPPGSVPPWITAARTPLCDRMLANGSAAAALQVGGSAGLLGIDCFTEASLGLWYPVSMEATRNPSYSLAS